AINTGAKTKIVVYTSTRIGNILQLFPARSYSLINSSRALVGINAHIIAVSSNNGIIARNTNAAPKIITGSTECVGYFLHQYPIAAIVLIYTCRALGNIG